MEYQNQKSKKYFDSQAENYDNSHDIKPVSLRPRKS